jgi:hypothetical protein
VEKECDNYGIWINTKKDQSHGHRKKSDSSQHNGAKWCVGTGTKCKYLSAWINDKGSPDEEIRCRIESPRAVFVKMKKVLTAHHFPLDLRIRTMKCGVETWTLKVATLSRLEAFRTWYYHRMTEISWTAKKINNKILPMVKREREQLIMIIKRRKLE